VQVCGVKEPFPKREGGDSTFREGSQRLAFHLGIKS